MSVHPTRFHANGTMDVYHDEMGCSGVVAISDVELSEDLRHIIIHCPGGCDSFSRHGASGAVHTENVQRLFVRRIAQHRHVSFLDAREIHRRVLDDAGLIERWCLQDVVEPDEGYVPPAIVMEPMDPALLE